MTLTDKGANLSGSEVRLPQPLPRAMQKGVGESEAIVQAKSLDSVEQELLTPSQCPALVSSEIRSHPSTT